MCKYADCPCSIFRDPHKKKRAIFNEMMMQMSEFEAYNFDDNNDDDESFLAQKNDDDTVGRYDAQYIKASDSALPCLSLAEYLEQIQLQLENEGTPASDKNKNHTSPRRTKRKHKRRTNMTTHDSSQDSLKVLNYPRLVMTDNQWRTKERRRTQSDTDISSSINKLSVVRQKSRSQSMGEQHHATTYLTGSSSHDRGHFHKLNAMARVAQGIVTKNNENVRLSNIGPGPGASMTLVSEKKRVVVEVVWSVSSWPANKLSLYIDQPEERPRYKSANNDHGFTSSQWFLLKVVPLVGFNDESSEMNGKETNSAENCLATVRTMERNLLKKIAQMENHCSYGTGQSWRGPCDPSNPSELLRAFVELSDCIAATLQRDDVNSDIMVDLLRDEADECCLLTDMVSCNSFIYSACRKVAIQPGDSMDLFDLYKLDRERNNTADHDQSNIDHADSKSDKDPTDICLVCLETLKDDAHFTVKPCNHGACTECWMALLGSAASSGLTRVGCPAFRCSSHLDMADIGQLLLADECTDLKKCSTDKNDSQRIKILSQLVKFSLEQTGLRVMEHCHSKQGGDNDKKEMCVQRARFCPTPACGRILLSSVSCNENDEASEDALEIRRDGTSLFLCPCGASVCAECTSGLSHPGLSCTEFGDFKKSIDSRKMDGELASLNWIVNFARPCPQCHFLIFRFDGCNHMSCSQCSHYFCWQCGGPGELCKAFYCSNTENFWTDNPDSHPDDRAHKDLARLVAMQRSFRHAQSRIAFLQKRSVALKQSRQGISSCWFGAGLEMQLQQVKLWLLAYDIVRKLNGTPGGGVDEKQNGALDRVDLLLHAVGLRNVASNNCEHNSNFDLDENDVVAVTGTKKQRAISKRKQQTQQKRNARANSNVARAPSASCLETDRVSFHSRIADLELAELCNMTPSSFAQAAKKAVHQAMAYLVPAKPPNGKSRRRRKKTVQNEDHGATSSVKADSTSGIPPWKLGLHQVVEDDTETEEGKQRWKRGKERVGCRRNVALDRTREMLL